MSRQLEQAKLLADRLARLSADSIWARRASGLRISLDKLVEQIESGAEVDPARLDQLTWQALAMLAKAAHEIPAPEEILRKYDSKNC
jgi:predicted RNA-binding Zn ribbon-like protein